MLTGEGYGKEQDTHPCSTSGRTFGKSELPSKGIGLWKSSELPILGGSRKRLDVPLSERARMNLFVEWQMGLNPLLVQRFTVYVQPRFAENVSS